MTLARYNLTAVDAAGNILPSATVEVRSEQPGAPLASLFTDRDGLSAAGNPITADANGDGGFYCAAGFFKITVTSGAFSKIWRYVPVGLLQGFDSLAFSDLTGNIAVSQINNGTGATSSTFLRGDGTWASLPAPPVTGTEIQFSSFNPVGNGSTDDTAAFLALIAAINADTAHSVVVRMGNGNYAINSATMGTPSITRDRVTIEGDGCTITVTGTTVVQAVFTSDGMDDITYRNIRFIGNSQANAFANGAAIWFVAYTAGSCSGFLVEHCYFDNFKGDYWVFAECLDARSITNVVVRNNFAVSRTGNARGPAVITINSSFVGIHGAGDVNHPMAEVLIENNVVYADYIKCGVVIQNYVNDFTIQNNTIWNAGQQGISNDVGAYAIMIYANTPFFNGKYGRTTGNKILFPRSIGIYQANIWPGSIITNNFIESQGPDTLNTTLPKGGICLNGSCETTVTGNIIVGTTKDAIFCNTSPTLNTGLNISNNTIRGADRGIVFESATNNGRNVVIQDNLIRDVTTHAIMCRSYTGVSTSDVTVRNNQIQLLVNASLGIVFDSPTSTFQLFYCNIQGNTIRANAPSGGTCQGITFKGFTGASSIIRDNTLFGTFAVGVDITGSTGVTAATNTTIA